MTIYILAYNDDTGCVSEEYVTKEEDIERLAIDYYWGTLTEPEPGRLKVTVDMVWNVVIVSDTFLSTKGIEYNILEFKQKVT
jgi:hypothetical protein